MNKDYIDISKINKNYTQQNYKNKTIEYKFEHVCKKTYSKYY